jgi:methylenetetrahydrofolate dehydrogenase (NADP+)/methenyltetrahydrofolate cyclohydrolase/formyltetrahydrofolate synthetase
MCSFPLSHDYLTYSCSSDTPAELELVRQEALAAGADAALVSNHLAEGGAGARALAEAVIATCEGESAFRFLYDLNIPIAAKIETICKEIYHAAGIELSDLASKQLETYTRQGYSNLPSKSLSS